MIENKPEKRIFFQLDSTKVEAVTVLKSMSVDFSAKIVTKYVLGKMCEDGPYERANPHSFVNVKDVPNIMMNFANQKMCAGIADEKYEKIQNVSTGFFGEGNNIWRSNEYNFFNIFPVPIFKTIII